jgi:hypothetical protein
VSEALIELVTPAVSSDENLGSKDELLLLPARQIYEGGNENHENRNLQPIHTAYGGSA